MGERDFGPDIMVPPQYSLAVIGATLLWNRLVLDLIEALASGFMYQYASCILYSFCNIFIDMDTSIVEK